MVFEDMARYPAGRDAVDHVQHAMVRNNHQLHLEFILDSLEKAANLSIRMIL
jgi:hypothetical protein